METSRRKYILKTCGVVASVGLVGCTGDGGETPTQGVRDSDGDGVIDSEDYAPRDADVQERADVQSGGGAQTAADTATPAEAAETDTAVPTEPAAETPAATPTETPTPGVALEEEVVLPESGIEGLSSRNGAFFTLHADDRSSAWYFINPDGSVKERGGYSRGLNGVALSNDARYLAFSDSVEKFSGDSDEERETDLPGIVESLCFDGSNETLWVGTNGALYELDPESLDIEQTHTFREVFGLAYDGTHLWIGEEDSDEIKQYDPAAEQTVETYEYPRSGFVDAYTYFGGILWLGSDMKLYRAGVQAE